MLSVTVMMLRDIVESVILLNDDACTRRFGDTYAHQVITNINWRISANN